MKKSRKIEVVLFVLTLVVLVVIWAMNGYKDTWLYITALIIAIPIGWYTFSKDDDGE